MEEQFKELSDTQLLITPKEVLGYAEEYIVVKMDNPKNNELICYSLSNNLDDIEIAVFNRTGHYIDLRKAHWKMNSNLSISVKHLMRKHRVRYSMTILQSKKHKQIFVNMCADDVWFITGFDELFEDFHCWNKIETYQASVDLLNEILLNSGLS
jgi:hypothetical protein